MSVLMSNHVHGIVVVVFMLLASGHGTVATGGAAATVAHHPNGFSNSDNTIASDRRAHTRRQQQEHQHVLSVKSTLRMIPSTPISMRLNRFRIDLLTVRGGGGSDNSFAYNNNDNDAQDAAMGQASGMDDMMPPSPSLPLDQQPFQDRIDAWKRYQQVRTRIGVCVV